MPNAKSLACGFAFTQQLGFYAADFYVVQQEGNKHFLLFCIASWRTINHIVQKATTTSVFLCCIARSNGNEFIVYVILQEAMTSSMSALSYWVGTSN